MRGSHWIRRPLLAVFVALSAMTFAVFVDPSHKVIYNGSSSVPPGWYESRPARSLSVGMMVLVRLPQAAQQMAERRHYLPAGVPVLKHIAAVPGTKVCEDRGAVTVNGKLMARALSHDALGRVLIPWSGCRALAETELFLLNSLSRSSFDSRYFGPVDRSQVIGAAFPIWTW
jgi:conjugative transfer signal peptidase TraF